MSVQLSLSKMGFMPSMMTDDNGTNHTSDDLLDESVIRKPQELPAGAVSVRCRED